MLEQKIVKFQYQIPLSMEQEYSWNDLQKLERREDEGSEYIEAYSGLGDLRIRERESEVQFIWETDSDFKDVLEAVEMFYRRKNGIEALEKDDISGNMSYEKIRDYVLGGPLRGGEVAEWDDYELIQIGGDDFYVSWKPDSNESQVRLSTSGSGILPFASVYSNTVDGDSQQVIDEVEKEFYDHVHDFPGFWNPEKSFD